MTIEIKEVIKQGDKRWIRHECPQCGYKLIMSVHKGGKREQEVDCPDCNAKFIITWDETDETLH